MIGRRISWSKLAFMLVGVLALTKPLDGAAKDVFTNEEIRDIEKFAGDVMGCANIPGLALGVVRGQATFTTGLGVANMITGHQADKKTIFNIGSTSKALVPYILAEIMNGKENADGRVKWNSTLKEIFNNDLDTGVPRHWAETTLEDMLVYKSGSSAADLTTMAGLPKEVIREDVVRRLRFLPTTSDFQNSNHYSNIMYTVAGHVAERLSGMPWAELLKIKVFDKLAMNTTTFAPEGMSIEDAALPYRFQAQPGDPFVEQNESLFNLHPFTPAGSLMVSAEDVTKWMRQLLHNLQNERNDSGINMLITDAFHQWVTVPSDHRDGALTHDSEVALGYGMGWFASTYRGQRRFQYGGSLYAYSSQIWLFPDSMSAIFVSINGPGNERAHRALQGIMYHISDITLRKPLWVNLTMACCCRETDYDYDERKNSVAPAEIKLIKYMAPVEKYMGVYGHGLVGDLRIDPNAAGVLILKLGQNLVGELTPGVTESKLKFVVTSPLLNTEEWNNEKTLEFLVSTPPAGGVGNSELYDKVRIYMKDHLFYEFNRGKLFDTLLFSAEEDEKRQHEEIGSFNHNNHKGDHFHNVSSSAEIEYSYEDNDAVKDDADVNDSNHSAHNLHQGGDNKKSGSHKNDIKPSSNIDLETGRNANTDSHQSHQPYSSDNDLEESNHDKTKGHNKDAENDSKTKDKNQSSSKKSGNTGSKLQTFSIVTFIITLLNAISNY